MDKDNSLTRTCHVFHVSMVQAAAHSVAITLNNASNLKGKIDLVMTVMSRDKNVAMIHKMLCCYDV